MRKAELRIDVTEACGLGERIFVAASIIAGDDVDLGNPLVMYGWPGGGYNRKYFDLQISAKSSYSQAEFHVVNGGIFVACDHVGVGDSAIPNGALDNYGLAKANQTAALEILRRLKDGTAIEGLAPIRPAAVIGMGQSYGGLLLTLAEAAEPLFDGVAMLGWSGIQAVNEYAALARDPRWPELATRGEHHPMRRIFHYDDVDEAIVRQDMSGYPARLKGEPLMPWGSKWMPGGPNARVPSPLEKGIVAAEAGMIRCAVFIGVGERDVCPDPRLEGSAYRSASDITTFILPKSSHMHNFANSRHILWNRLQSWGAGLARAKAIPHP